MEKVILTGNNLTVEEVWEIAVNGAKVEISAEAQKKLEDARAFVMDILNSDTPVYGLNRGVEGMKTVERTSEKVNQQLIQQLNHIKNLPQ